ncbi:MAG: type II toxin-antitoxin system VapC family toxin [Deltaproteobacteria bacterium]|nr:type II toxin-antitoxin system VapC family toxin [Deltaproteobacteria bacterium]MBW2596196.1 type II toxin-antitoxin system VapC family toxin [Deltaproteobacteria bacterium]MBW2649743.1 type II toxin-antitoxin system VapC family toxin [Deltaproteobacteria bacterium]
MLYVDTSIIVKLYVKEEHSLDASNRIIENNEAIPLTGLHDLEFTNAINLKLFRKEITEDEANCIISRFHEHESKGVYYRPQLSWAEAFRYAVDLSGNHTGNTGSRSLDILHVASALSIKADRFFTIDTRQSKLASLAGLKVVKVKGSYV